MSGFSRSRDPSIDFVRFVFILMMVVYHCFYNAEIVSGFSRFNINSFLGFVSGGFPWLSGYLIGNRYFHSERLDSSLKLLFRAFKMLGIYFIANLAALPILHDTGYGALIGNNIEFIRLIKVILSGNPKSVIYDILIALGMVPFICAVILFAIKAMRPSYKMKLQIVISSLIIVYSNGLLYLACGLFGVMFGLRDANAVSAKNKRWVLSALVLFALSYCLLIANYFDDPRKAGVFYAIGVSLLFYGVKGFFTIYSKLMNLDCRYFVLYARHSLFIYLFHVPVLFFARNGIGSLLSDFSVWWVFLCLLLMICIVIHVSLLIIEYVVKGKGMKIYKAIFL